MRFLEGRNDKARLPLWLTVGLGAIFTGFQVYEYVHTIYNPVGFQISSQIFGSTFYMATGFHGFHVFIGTTFPSGLPLPGVSSAFQAGEAYRLRVGCLVLALRRRCLAISVLLGLLVGRQHRRRRALNGC